MDASLLFDEAMLSYRSHPDSTNGKYTVKLSYISFYIPSVAPAVHPSPCISEWLKTERTAG
jgi:hypothetical protein